MTRALSPHLSNDPYLRRRQREYDEGFFDRVYAELSPANSKIRHIREHVGKVGLRLELLRRGETKASSEVIKKAVNEDIVPNLAMYRTQIANTLRIDLESALNDCPRKKIDLGTAVGLIVVAGGYLDYRTEPLEHNNEHVRNWRKNIREIALPELHLAATGLALAYDLGSVDRLHARRLEFLSSQPAIGL